MPREQELPALPVLTMTTKDSPPSNGTQLAQDLAKRYQLPYPVVHRLLGDAFHTIEAATIAHGRFQFRGFGTWRLRLSAPRLVRDIRRDMRERKLVERGARAVLSFVHGGDRRAAFNDLGLERAKAEALGHGNE
jgi:nucleoid DNA-binding protein